MTQDRHDTEDARQLGVAGIIARAFINSPLTPLIIVGSILLGIAAIWLLPREEEPQIRVPMIDVFVAMPGLGAREIEERLTRPMEKLLWEIPGVEYIYSTSREGQSLVIVRFKVGEEMNASLVKLDTKLRSNFDRIPQGASPPLIKPKSIDDVPILALTLHGGGLDHYALRRVAAQLDDAVKQVPLVAETQLIGGARRQLRVLLDPVRLASRELAAAEVVPMLQAANRQLNAGTLTADDTSIDVQAGEFVRDATDAGSIVIGAHDGRPIYLRDVARIEDGPEEPSQYVFHGTGRGPTVPAVTISIAKRPGANAIAVAQAVLHKVEDQRGRILPRDVEVTVTRNYGETAREKSDELLLHMGIAVIGVSVLILLALGWRESLIVGLAIPSTLSLTLLVFYLYGYTLNRITLFALIFSIGILVDDAIVVVENIVRHVRLPQNQGRSRAAIAIDAVNEVGNPTILATFAVIAAVVPMAFVGGLMGPYMRPIPVGSSAAMMWSLAIAFIVTPWAAIRLLRRTEGTSPAAVTDDPLPAVTSHFAHPEDFFTRLYRRMMGPLIARRGPRAVFLVGIVLLLIAAMATVGLGWVKVKMLPFDNKSEFQIILNMPEDASLERTAQVAREIAEVVRGEPEVTDFQVYVGVAAPYNFNGLVRHYFLRGGAHHADLQVNLLPKSQRAAQSHDIATRVRPRIAAIAARYGARIAVAEVPPGPPVLQTLVAEIYGPDEQSRSALAQDVRALLQRTPGVVDVDWYVESDRPKALLVVDREKAAKHGISNAAIAQTVALAVGGPAVDLLHLPREKEDVPILVRLPQALRDSPEALLALRVRGPDPTAPLVPLGELVHIEYTTVDRSIYHKNLMPVTYVIGDVAGVVESPVYAILDMNKSLAALDSKAYGGDGRPIEIYNAQIPFSDASPAMKWDGEWHITIEVFRDLGTAFAAVLVLIYMLMVGWFRSFVTPLVVMLAIPFSLVGILPAHGLLNAFFTATSMIGFMAGAGIVVRNSIILVDFIELRVAEGMPLADAVVDAGAVRFRPMLLTALAVVVGASVILADPIFQGLAIALMAGEIASLLLSRMAVPVLYYMLFERRVATAPPHEAA